MERQSHWGFALLVVWLPMIGLAQTAVGAQDSNGDGTTVPSGTSVYVFVPGQSTMTQSGGIAGIYRVYSIAGRFQLTIDPNAATVTFDRVDADAADDGPPRQVLDLNDLFNMTNLTSVVADGIAAFEDKTADQSSIHLTLVFDGNCVYLIGETTPPPGSADFFVFTIDATAQRKYGGGTGEPNSPYQIWTPKQMNAIGDEPNDWNRHFKVMADIDLGASYGARFNVIGNDRVPFTGVLDGDDRKILHFRYTCRDQNNVGLIGSAFGYHTEVRNLHLIAPTVRAANGSNVGSIVGYLGEGTKMTNCSAVDGYVAGRENVGGLVGKSGPEVTRPAPGTYPPIINCHFSGSVSGRDLVGGLVGYNQTSPIKGCCATGSVAGRDRVGGLAGMNEYGFAANCYAIVSVIAYSNVGGLTGKSIGTIMNCYAAGRVTGSEGVGGLVGSGSHDVIESFWDIETSGQASSVGGTGKTTAELQTAATFLSWNAGDSEPIWMIEEGKDLPRLVWEGRPGRLIEPLHLSDLLQGTGTAGDPYLIYTPEELNAVALYRTERDRYFTLMADIDLGVYAPDEFNIIRHFSGVFEGNNHVISNLTCHIGGRNGLGLFGYIRGPNAEVRNLRLVHFNLDVGSTASVGALAGLVWQATIVNCHASGGTIVAGSSLGGLVGENRGTVTNCHASGIVSGSEKIGGIVGSNDGILTDCYAEGEVTGRSHVGGLAGSNRATVVACWSSGVASGDWSVGGLIGNNQGKVTDCYSACVVSCARRGGGGLVGINYGAISYSYAVRRVTGSYAVGGLVGETDPSGGVFASFWDTRISGQPTSAGGTGKTTTQMQTASTFADWGHQNRWTLDEGHDYPRLAWENRPGAVIAAPIPTSIQGTGSDHDPYLIRTAEELNTIGLFPSMWSAHIKLMADIDLFVYPGSLFHVIGIREMPFTGVFDGNDHTISNFSYSRIHNASIGLFGHVDGPNAQIKNVGVVNSCVGGRVWDPVGALVSSLDQGEILNCYTKAVAVSGGNFAGGLVGHNNGNIADCRTNGSVTGYSVIGGLAGRNRGNITGCSSTVTVNGGESAGGFLGENGRGAVVTRCSSAGIVTGRRATGGFAGYNEGNIANCYSLATLSGEGTVAGLVGENGAMIVDCYSAGKVVGDQLPGGLVGLNTGTVVGSFWDIQTSGQLTSAGGTGKATSEMQKASTFLDAGWDFVGEVANGMEDFRWIDEGRDYPRLWWE
jgi:hypothetical protein